MFTNLHPKEQLARIIRRIYHRGLTTTSGGNLSIRDADGNTWMTPSGIDKGSLKASDMVCIRADGQVVGKHRPSVELPLHIHIYRLRPDLSAIVHAHPPAMVAYSLNRSSPALNLLPGIQAICGQVAIAPYAVPGSAQLGENIALQFARGYNSVLMENHGCVVGAADLLQGFHRFETLEFAANLQIEASKLGRIHHLKDQMPDELPVPLTGLIGTQAFKRGEATLRRSLRRFAKRAYAQNLLHPYLGSISARLGQHAFLLTPPKGDLFDLDEASLLHLSVTAKLPRGSDAALHQTIYRQHPAIGSIFLARPIATMAYATTHTGFDSRLIPESYIVLRQVKNLPHTLAKDFGALATALSPQSPAMLIHNHAAITTGKDLLQAFDRLEVLDYSARAIIATRQIGQVVQINDSQAEEIERIFQLG